MMAKSPFTNSKHTFCLCCYMHRLWMSNVNYRSGFFCFAFLQCYWVQICSNWTDTMKIKTKRVTTTHIEINWTNQMIRVIWTFFWYAQVAHATNWKAERGGGTHAKTSVKHLICEKSSNWSDFLMLPTNDCFEGILQ